MAAHEMVIKPIAWSFTSISAFRTCPRQYHEIRVLKNFKEEKNEVSIWGDRVHKAFEASLRDGVPLPEDMQLWQPTVEQFRGLKGKLYVENELAITQGFQPCDWFADDVWCRGIIDALWIDGTVAKAVDWKTGKRKPNSDQLALFALLVFHHFPEVQEVRTMFVWLKTLEQDKATYGRMHIPELWQKFIPDLHRLKDAYDNERWPARTSGLCRKHCAVVTCPYNGNHHLARGVK
jgi:hypothetical protein